MMGAFLGLVALAAAIAWLSTMIHAVLLVPHRRDDISIFQLWLQGHRFYQSSTWKESGQGLYRRFRMSAAAFFVVVLLGIVSGFVLGGR